MERDAEGFLYPVVDNHCLHCGLCNQVCPFENPPAEAPILGVYAAKARSEKLRNASTSGGMFTVLAKPVIAAEGGAVYGVVMNEDRKGCSFAKATFESELGGMRRSKYVQADASGVYERVATDLRAGKQVLFVGAPCQVNALKLFLGRPFENLLAVDFICHGVPSPRLWEACVEDFEERAGALTFVNFRNKEHGWRKFGLLRRTEGGDDLEMVGESPYLNIFLRSYAERESCFECRAKTQRSSDITIADFWGIEDALPEFSDYRTVVFSFHDLLALGVRRIERFVQIRIALEIANRTHSLLDILHHGGIDNDSVFVLLSLIEPGQNKPPVSPRSRDGDHDPTATSVQTKMRE